ncbi:MAG: hypothetical protein LH468_08000 [Nocardioides sp.]|nr:hypothetical protein [Nocardioides sp.]
MQSNPSPARRPTFGSFWHGPPLSAYEQACISSFVKRGYEFVVYAYDVSMSTPPGVELRDAREVTPLADVDLFIYDGRPNLSHFSDYFRYRMFDATDHVWVDTDILLIDTFPEPVPATLLTKETEDSLCGAVMRLDPSELPLDQLISRTRDMAGRSLHWGETGPQLLTTVFADSDLRERAAAPDLYYPVLYDVFWKVFLPEEYDACDELCANAATLHLWNNIVVQLGIWKDLAPPRGSYLHHLLELDNSLHLFRETYPEDVMRRMVENWRLRFSGADVGGGNLLRQLGPSALRTARRRGWLRP